MSKKQPTSIDAGGHRAKVLARRDELVENHLHIVPPIARWVMRSLPPCFELDDLIAAGNFGLLRAATRYRRGRGTLFSTFAYYRVRGAMRDWVRRSNYEHSTRPPIDDLWPDPAESLDSYIDQVMTGERLRAAIKQLPTAQRAVIEAYYAETEGPVLGDAVSRSACVAAALGMPEYQVLRDHADAIAALRTALEGAA